jgi:predicted O-methyltransferase YrrM
MTPSNSPPVTAQSAAAITASPRVQQTLARLHAASEAQEKSVSQIFFYIKWIISYYVFGDLTWSPAADAHMRDKFVSLEADKCQFMYLLARSTGARHVVEAGTSFGVSTIYLALAVSQNVSAAKATAASGSSEISGKVIATEKEPTKAKRAREHWKEAGEEEIYKWIELREGDLLETLRVNEGMPQEVDMLLLDSKSVIRVRC